MHSALRIVQLGKKKLFFVRRTLKVSFVDVVLRAESWFSRISVVKFYVCGKSIFRTQNDIVSVNFRYTANKKYRSYHVRKGVF